MVIEQNDRQWFLVEMGKEPIVKYIVNAESRDEVQRFLGVLKNFYTIDEIAYEDVLEVFNDAARIKSIAVSSNSMDILINITNHFYILQTIF